MKGKTLRQFIDDLYYNAETEFILNGEQYMIEGWLNEDGTYTLSLSAFGTGQKELFQHTARNRRDCVEAFEKSRLFDGKSIYDIEKDIVVECG